MPGYELINSLEKKALINIFKEGSIFLLMALIKLENDTTLENLKIYVKNTLMLNIV